ncbi:MAG: hypothetical protein ABIB79_00990 [archaeon]
MENINYNNIGNLGDYKPERCLSVPSGLITTPNLVLKMYDMLRVVDREQNPLKEAREFIKKEIEEGKITPWTGMGFSILSNGFLNVSRWDTKYPSVVKNRVYEFDNSKTDRVFDSARLNSLEEDGCFCVWELGIVTHEKEAWKRFISSKRTRKDKQDYLEDMITGDL